MKWIKCLLVGLIILGIDMASKAYVHAHIPYLGWALPYYPYGGIGLFKGFLGGIDFSINHIHNTGAAWGTFSSFQNLLMVLRIGVIALLSVYLIRFNKAEARRLPLVCVIAGAVGNVIDYFIYGYVIDFFHFRFWGYTYPLFNVADSAIFCGICVLIVQSLWSRHQKPKGKVHAD